MATRAYFFVYGTRTTIFERVGRFFAHDWPAAAKATWRETVVCAALAITGVAVAYILVLQDPAWFNAFVPGGLAQGRGPDASTSALRETLFGHANDPWLTAFATFLFTHNAGVALLAFALGFAFGLPSAMLEIYNGCTLGAFLAVFVGHGLGWEAGGWLLIHGVTELTATVLAGAAGMRIGWSLAFPGDRSRLEAAAFAGRQSATLMAGVFVMLFCAGILEGVGRQMIQDTTLRYAIAAASAVVWFVYLYSGRGGARAGGEQVG